jgi:hypothetical protein
MNAAAEALAATLAKKYGSNLLTLDEVARELRRSKEGLRQALYTEKMTGLRNCKKQIGRRVYFSCAAFALYCCELSV